MWAFYFQYFIFWRGGVFPMRARTRNLTLFFRPNANDWLSGVAFDWSEAVDLSLRRKASNLSQSWICISGATSQSVTSLNSNDNLWHVLGLDQALYRHRFVNAEVSSLHSKATGFQPVWHNIPDKSWCTGWRYHRHIACNLLVRSPEKREQPPGPSTKYMYMEFYLEIRGNSELWVPVPFPVFVPNSQVPL